jgi:hypothetical protein
VFVVKALAEIPDPPSGEAADTVAQPSLDIIAASFVPFSSDRRIWVKLEDNSVQCGEVLRGEVRLRNSVALAARGVRIALTGTERTSVPAGFDPVYRRNLLVRNTRRQTREKRGGEASRGQGDNRLELKAQLDACAWTAGKKLTGSFSMRNGTRHRVRAVKIQLVGEERAEATTFGKQTAKAKRLSKSLKVDIGEGETVVENKPFAFSVPSLPPPFSGKICRLSWYVEVRVDVAWARDLKVKMSISTK